MRRRGLPIAGHLIDSTKFCEAHRCSRYFALFLPQWYLFGTWHSSGYLKGLAHGEAENDRAQRRGGGGANLGPKSIYWDADNPGFGLRVATGGRMTWDRDVPAQQCERRLTIGAYPTPPLAEAREKAGAGAPCRPVRRRRPAAAKRPRAKPRASPSRPRLGQAPRQAVEMLLAHRC